MPSLPQRAFVPTDLPVEASSPLPDSKEHSDPGAEPGPPSQPTDLPVTAPAATQVEGFRQIYDTPTRLYLFWIAFAIWAVALALSYDTTFLYLAFATSHFQSNPKLATIGLLTGILGAVVQPFWGKLADMWRRSWCLGISVGMYTLGYAISAGAGSVSALAAGQIIYSTGSAGLSYAQTLIVADITSLEYRGLVYGLISFSYVPFAFVAPNIASGIGLEHWRWGYGMFCIIMPVCLLPIVLVLLYAEKRGTRSTPSTSHDRTRGIRRLADKLELIDPIGLLLIGFAFALLLAPPTLYAQAKGGWRNPSMIAMEVVGGVILVGFAVWEWKYCRYPILPRRIFNLNYSLCLFSAVVLALQNGIYNTYWSSWVWVVKDYTEREWTYLTQTYAVSLSVLALFGGIGLRLLRRFKYLQIGGLAACSVGAGINYLSAEYGRTNTAALVMAQFLVGGGGSVALLAAQTAAQGSVTHADLAMSIAVWVFVNNISNAVGASIGGSLWSDGLVRNLAQLAPSLNDVDIGTIAGDITAARSAEPREAIVQAYDRTYRSLALGGLVAITIPIVTSFFCRDYELDGRQNARQNANQMEGQ